MFNTKLIKLIYLHYTHRLGNPKNSIKSKPRLIIVKFVRYNTRNAIYGTKKSFKRKRDKCDRMFNCKEDQDSRESKGIA